MAGAGTVAVAVVKGDASGATAAVAGSGVTSAGDSSFVSSFTKKMMY